MLYFLFFDNSIFFYLKLQYKYMVVVNALNEKK